MKNDIDFDELDKAVNSLMGAIPADKQSDTGDEAEQKVLAISPTLQPDEKPAYEKLDEAAKKIGSETLVDDEQTTVVASPASESVPVVSVSAPLQPEDPPVVQERTRMPIVPRPSSGRFMDVVSSAAIARPPAVAAPVSPAAPVVVSPPVESSLGSILSDDEPTIPAVDLAPMTPFLPDAKVEKRPLGTASQNDESISSIEALQAPVVSDQRPLEGDEQGASFVALETEPEVAKHDGSQAVLDATDFEGQSDELLKLQAIEASDTDKLTADMHESVRRVESSDTEKMIADANDASTTATPGTIYDVNEYHQPLDHADKQKSGWGVVVVIIVIIILAALLGAGAYFFFNLGA